MGRDDIGILEKGKAADIILVDLNDIAYVGCHDPLVGMVSCGNTSFTKMTIVNGSIAAVDGKILNEDMDKIKTEAVRISSEIVRRQRESA